MPRLVSAPFEGALQPVSARRTLQDEVHRGLAQALMAGRFDPGQTLTIAALADQFGTSHMPVREALRRLAAENALEVSSSGTVVVPAVSRERLDDLCDARLVVEGAAAERAAGTMTTAVLRRLEHLAREHAEAGREKDAAAMLARNQEFHFAIYAASGSAVLDQLAGSLWLRFGPYLRMLTKQMEPLLGAGEIETYTRHHVDILEALKAGDAEAAGRHLRADIRSTQHLLQPLCPSESAPASLTVD
ncbi:GntR family transcriptional regulator [Antarcticirhabdus aurantiaca]|uniref:GntR family transcriptional regulator n=1 Tax=Antarcticirhabdus aurantiaca TaxID=2606717 RepID=A0ACD4NMQ3_9HYPH|nr:GntR family transcriptional regulator [Antarcticirhabdus aurantiaca]WAJ28131.1 GntR family transcriptional regulator [Jeongeuplla avenae]